MQDNLLLGVFENKVRVGMVNPLGKLVEEAIKKRLYNVGVEAVEIFHPNLYSQDYQSTIQNIYLKCGYQNLFLNNYNEAEDCFLRINFNPEEMLDQFFKEFMLDAPFKAVQYSKLSLNFLINIFNNKRK